MKMPPTPQLLSNMNMQACERCWRRKQKCDRRIPKCTPCAQQRLSCVQRGRQQVAPANTDTQGFITSLQLRLRELKSHGTPQELVGGSTSPSACPIPQDQTLNHELVAGAEPSPSGFSTNQTVHTSLHGLGSLSLHTMSEGRTKAKDPRTRSVYLAFLAAAVGAGQENPALSATQSSLDKDSIGEILRTSRSEFCGFSTLYSSRQFDVFLRYSALHGSVVACDVAETIFKEAQDFQDEGKLAHMVELYPERATLAFLMAAYSICLGEASRSGELIFQSLIYRARDCIRSVALRAESFRMAQCLVLFSVVSTFYPEGGSTWHLLGLATMECLSLGMHNKARLTGETAHEISEKGTLFWVLFVIDRSVSLAYGRPFSLNQSDITIEPPTFANSTMGGDESMPRTDSLLCEAVSHALLITDFRHNKIRDYCFHGANHQNWCQKFPIWEKKQPSTEDLAVLWACKQQWRLRCRAWVELCLIMARDPKSADEALGEAPTEDITWYLQTLITSYETNGLLISTIEALDALAGAICYVHFTLRRHFVEGVSSPQTRLSSSLPSSQEMWSPITTTADILTTISHRFGSMLRLRQVLRTFISHVDQTLRRGNSYDEDSNRMNQRLHREMEACGDLLPRDLQGLLKMTVDKARLCC